ncbi:hypothetical protein OK006_7625 [Actinobacteria bacterium OK006]|nr:hypothetical protein OK006_7625 [Actinobacteria bacterium OK006]
MSLRPKLAHRPHASHRPPSTEKPWRPGSPSASTGGKSNGTRSKSTVRPRLWTEHTLVPAEHMLVTASHQHVPQHQVWRDTAGLSGQAALRSGVEQRLCATGWHRLVQPGIRLRLFNGAHCATTWQPADTTTLRPTTLGLPSPRCLPHSRTAAAASELPASRTRCGRASCRTTRRGRATASSAAAQRPSPLRRPAPGSTRRPPAPFGQHGIRLALSI